MVIWKILRRKGIINAVTVITLFIVITWTSNTALGEIIDGKELMKKGLGYYDLGRYELALQEFELAYEVYKDLDDTSNEVYALIWLGRLSLELGNCEKAIDYYKQALKISKLTGDTISELMITRELAVNYWLLGQYDEASSYFEFFLDKYPRGVDINIDTLLVIADVYQKLDKVERLPSLLQSISFQLEKTGDAEKSINYWLQAFKAYEKVCEQLDDLNPLIYFLRSTLGSSLAEARFEAIIMYLKDNLYEYRRGNERVKELHTLLEIAIVDFWLGRHEETLNLLSQALTISKEIGDPKETLRVIWGFMKFFEEKGNLPRAKNYALQGLGIARKNENLEYQAEFLSWLAGIHFESGQYKKAIDCREEAISIYEKMGDLEGIASELVAIGATYRQLGKAHEAMGIYQNALEMHKKLNNSVGIARDLMAIGTLYSGVGRYKEAQEYLTVSLKMFYETGFLWDHPEILLCLSENSLGMGQYEEALRTLLFLKQLSETINDTYMLASACADLSRTYISLGLTEKAQIYLEKVQNIFKKSKGYKRLEGYLEDMIGTILLSQNSFNEALKHIERAGDIFREINDKEGEINNLILKSLCIGSLRFKSEDFGKLTEDKQLLNDLLRALKLSRQTGNRASESLILTIIGGYYYSSNDFETALAYLRKSGQIAEAGSMALSSIAITENLLAQTYEKLNDHALALEHYESSLKKIEAVRRGLKFEEHKAGLLQNYLEMYKSYVSFLVNLHYLNPEGNYHAKAFAIAERAKARVFLDIFCKIEAYRRKPVESEFQETETKIKSKIKEITQDLQNELVAKEQKSLLMNELKRQKNELELFRLVSLFEKEKINISSPQLIGYSEAQSFLNHEDILLEYVLGEEKSFLWMISKNDFKLFELPKREILEKLVRSYLDTLEQPFINQGKLKNHVKLGQELFRMLLPNEVHLFNFKRLIIVPDEILYYLPFESLIISHEKDTSASNYQDFNEVLYLIKELSISYFQSASVMASVLGKKASRVTAAKQKELLAFGDPIYDMEEELKEKEAVISIRSFLKDRGIGFERLKFTSEEVIKIAEALNVDKNSRDINLRENAKERILHDVDLKNYKRIHFATHGILADEISWINQPSLVLSLVGNEEAYDGFLKMNEVFNLDLDADLVVLSACKTGLGELIKGEGIIGLTRSFMYAGASSVVVSLWNVNDMSSSSLMEKFYNYLKTMNKAEALRQAKLDLLKGKSIIACERGVGGITGEKEMAPVCSHPYFWAPFILIGDWK